MSYYKPVALVHNSIFWDKVHVVAQRSNIQAVRSMLTCANYQSSKNLTSNGNLYSNDKINKINFEVGCNEQKNCRKDFALATYSEYSSEKKYGRREYRNLYCESTLVWYGMVWYGMVWYGMVWYGMVWYGMVWYGMV